MTEDRAELLSHYGQMRRELVAVIEGLSDALMTESSLDGWSVKDHLAHIALWDDLRASEVARISAGYESAWRMNGRDEEVSGLFHDVRVDLSLDQVRWELATSHQRLVDAIASATLAGLDAGRYGEAGLRSTHEAQHTGWMTRWRTENAARERG